MAVVTLAEAPAPSARRVRRVLLPLVVVALLGAMAFAMVTAALAQTPTTDEPVYVSTAIVYLQQHSLRDNPEHPPLGKLIMGAGLWFAHPKLDPHFAGDQWALGEQVLYHSGNDPWRLMFLARLPIIVLTLLFGLVVFAFARDVAGTKAGVFALVLYAFAPDLIAHGSLATLDVTAAGFLLTCVWLLWRARVRPGLYLPLAGLALGAAMATRMSVLPVVPVLLVLAGWSYGRGWWRGVVAAGGVLVIGLGVVWAAYLVVDPRLRFSGAGVPHIGGLRGLVTDLMPLPEAYRDGMRIQFGFEDQQFGGFLFGRQFEGSLWYYLPAAVLVKTPIGMLLLWLAGAVAVIRRPVAVYLLVPAAVLFAAAMTGSRDFGVRYVVFLPMILAVAAASVLTWRMRTATAVAAALAVWVAISSVLTFPYYIPYSNEAFGGPSKTYLRLHDSNSDWGQDLGRMADELAAKYPGRPVWLVYKGGGDPSAYGIEWSDPEKVPPDRVRGLLVLSNDAIDKADRRLQNLIDTSTPVEQVGHSMTVFSRL
jgi:hypothetical protein